MVAYPSDVDKEAFMDIFDQDLRPRESAYTSPDAGGGGDSHRFKDDDEVQPDTKTIVLPPGHWTLLPIIKKCDNASLPQGPFGEASYSRRAQEASENHEDLLIPFFVKEGDGKPVGFLRPRILEALILDNQTMVDKMKLLPCWKMLNTEGGNHTWGVAFEDWLNVEGRETRSEHMDRVSRAWQHQNLFSEELGGWRNELYPIYGPKLSQDDPNFNPLPGANVAFEIERAACSLFGFSTFGVHMTAYVKTPDGQYRFWIPKRSSTKETWPGYLDNSVAGGITSGDGPLEAIVRECEAALPPNFVGKKIRACGAISYIHRNKNGWLQPETQYIYDLKMQAPPEPGTSEETLDKAAHQDGEPVILRPNDGEAETFSLMTSEEVVDRIVREEFKPNCAIVLVDFFIRHGILNAEIDAKFLEICQRLRRSLSPLPGPA